jgi:hypothetical protein
VTVNGVWIGNWIYWTLFDTARDYTLQFTAIHTKCPQSVTVSASRCLVAASNGGRSPSSEFPNFPLPQLPASNSNNAQRLNCSSPLTHWLTNQILHFTPLVLLITSRHGPHRKHRSSVAVKGPLSSNGLRLAVCLAVVALQRVYVPQYKKRYKSASLLFSVRLNHFFFHFYCKISSLT